MADGESLPKEPNPFNITAQFADFVSLEGSNEMVIFQFGQRPIHDGDKLLPVARIALPYSLALELGKALNPQKVDTGDDVGD
jgi:hypothetical protein